MRKMNAASSKKSDALAFIALINAQINFQKPDLLLLIQL